MASSSQETKTPESVKSTADSLELVPESVKTSRRRMNKKKANNKILSFSYQYCHLIVSQRLDQIPSHCSLMASLNQMQP